jgi:hypothetical protein
MADVKATLTTAEKCCALHTRAYRGCLEALLNDLHLSPYALNVLRSSQKRLCSCPGRAGRLVCGRAAAGTHELPSGHGEGGYVRQPVPRPRAV